MGAMLVRPAPPSAAALRHRLRVELAAHGVDATGIDEVVLVASELFGNAVRHARSEDDRLDISWDLLGGEVLLRVTDGSHVVPVVRRVDADAENGRGMAIVEAVCTAWGVDQLSDGKRVWARIPVGTA